MMDKKEMNTSTRKKFLEKLMKNLKKWKMILLEKFDWFLQKLSKI
jgi:hypothetical protein